MSKTLSVWSVYGRVCVMGSVTLLLSACAATPSLDGGGLLGLQLPATGDDGKPRTLAELQRAHADKPKDADTTVAYARALKAGGKTREALAVVDAAAQSAPENQKLVVEQGLLALELGQSAKAQHALMRASPETTDWRVLSGLGVAHSGLGQHANAQRYLEKALVLSPENPTVLNNLALAYILDKKVDKGRELLQRAAVAGGDKPQIARNLEMAMALKGGGGPAAPARAVSSTPPSSAGTPKPPSASQNPAKSIPAPSESNPVPAEPDLPPATAVIPESKPEPRKTASVDKAALDTVTPKMLNLGGPLADR